MRYSELTRRYFESAPAAGTLSGVDVASGAAGGRAQGAWVQFHLRVERAGTERARIAEARFLAFGCPHVIAVAAWVAEQVVGRPPGPALPRTPEALRQLFDVPVEKLGRLLIVEDAWRAAVAAVGHDV